ncbi:hypothetical protein GQ53DRAFT_888838 [Thozetella sp. PMI_491]|nr:hypothetical protein GQ53DRAFT_888838 [Thozetella sp. PMI_491]
MADQASTFVQQDWWDEAEILEVKVMETRKTKLGAGYLPKLRSMYNLALAWTSAVPYSVKWHELEPITTPIPDARVYEHLEPSQVAKDLMSNLNTLLESPVATQQFARL